MAKYKIVRNNELCHYGILGMKWGQRNGPPYPLGYSQKNIRERKKVSSSSPRNDIDSRKSRKGLTDKQKKLIKVGAAIAVTGLAAYGAYKLSGNLPVSNTVNLPDPKFGGAILSKENVSNLVNGLNPGWPNEPGSQFNCANVAFALEKRFRGESFVAKMNEDGMTTSQFLSYIKDMPSKNIIEDIRPEISKATSVLEKSKIVSDTIKQSILDTYADDSRGAVFIPTSNGSHYFTWVKNGSDVQFIDGQSGNLPGLLDNCFSNYRYFPNRPSVALNVFRLDNVEFTDRLVEIARDENKINLSPTAFDAVIELGENFVMKWK